MSELSLIPEIFMGRRTVKLLSEEKNVRARVREVAVSRGICT